jgi:hypothetical protein
MSDPIDDLIAAVQVELCRFSQCANLRIAYGKAGVITRAAIDTTAKIYHTIGAVAASELHGLPCVCWVETGGKTDPLEAAQDGKLFADLVRLRVAVIAKDKESCRALFMNLRNAAKRVQDAFGITITFGNQTAPTEEKASKLTAVYEIDADVDVALAVDQNPLQLPGFPEPLTDYVLRRCVDAIDQTPENTE